MSTTSPASKGFDLHPITRTIVSMVAIMMSGLALYAIVRGLGGFAPAHPGTRSLAVMLHVSSVVPAIPLGAYLLLTRKGTALHKQLGKVWITRMVITALSALFIGGLVHFSWIYIFVPITLHGAWKTIATAHKGKIKAHKNHIIGMYLGALMIPGAVAFAFPGRLMNTLIFG